MKNKKELIVNATLEYYSKIDSVTGVKSISDVVIKTDRKISDSLIGFIKSIPENSDGFFDLSKQGFKVSFDGGHVNLRVIERPEFLRFLRKNLSTRAATTIFVGGIETIEKLMSCTNEELMEIEGMGNIYTEEVMNLIDSLRK